jgi:MFS family permease
MKKTIWVPVIFGVAMGIIAGITFSTNLAFFGGSSRIAGIGIYGIFWLMAAALGGPLAGGITVSLSIIIGALFGQMKTALSDPVTFWPNLIIIGFIIYPLVGFAYRLIFERLRLLKRILAWGGIVAGTILIGSPLLTITQFIFKDYSTLSGMYRSVYESFNNNLWLFQIATYKSFLPQVIAYFIITSLIFLALPERYRRPLWCEPKASLPNADKV